MFIFVRNYQTVFQSGCTVLHSHKQYMTVSAATHPLKGTLAEFLNTLVW
jgi:hypothetical protein